VPDVDPLPILAGGAAAFLIGGAYYGVMGDRLVAAGGGAEAEMPPWKLAVELLRGLVLAAVVAGLAVQGEIDDAAGGLALGLALWVGFPAVLWGGAVLHGESPWRLAAIHAGDWLAKLLVLGALLSAWQ
jgi:Protein of unknown function (DUF1761)